MSLSSDFYKSFLDIENANNRTSKLFNFLYAEMFTLHVLISAVIFNSKSMTKLFCFLITIMLTNLSYAQSNNYKTVMAAFLENYNAE